jgi:predicted Zn-dependent protease
MAKPITVVFEGDEYVWNGKKWFGRKTFLEPPKAIVSKLHALSARKISAQDETITDPDELLRRARQAQEHGQIQRALKLARLIHARRPKHIETVAMVCSILRTAKHPEKALILADKFRSSNYSAILTSRASALCDLNRWEEGLEQIQEVMANDVKSKKRSGSPAALSVYGRIKDNAPDLFDE